MELSGTKLLLHIGAPKCGSSAIQRFLANNATALRRQNVIVPGQKLEYGTNISGNHIWYIEELSSDIEAAKKVIASKLNSLAVEHAESANLVSSTNISIILSAENLVNKHNYLLFSDLPNFSVHPLVYVRRQDDFLISSWQQWHLKQNRDFWAWIISVLGKFGDWSRLLDPWVKTYSRQNISVMRFDQAKMHKMNLVSDFCLHCGLSEDGLDISVGNANPSFSEMVTDLAMRANSVFSSVHDNEFYHMISALTGERYHKSEKDVFLSAAQRRAILGHYQTSNAQLREQFFPELRSNEDIFSPIKETTYAQSINTESALLAELIFGLYKRLRSIEENKKT